VTFTLLPAVDVANGQVMHHLQGETSTRQTCATPGDAALAWQADGAQWVHLVDLDAAFGRGSNGEILAAVVRQLDIKVELSAGCHDDISLDRALATGCARVIVGTAALENPAWCAEAIARHGDRIAIGLDVRITEGPNGSVQHRLAARGTLHEDGDLWETIVRLDQQGCARYIVTDVSRDGMLNGPNMDLYRAVTNATTTPVIASGGVAAIVDLTLLAGFAASGAKLEGAIVGKALYTDQFTLPKALAAVALHADQSLA
jgi:phosphoribosylanthranilate isomerase